MTEIDYGNADVTSSPDPGYFDVGAYLDDNLPEPPVPDVCPRDDGIGLFYRNQYNVVFSDPEAGKTLLCDHASVQELKAGGRVLRLDFDHNGGQSTISRLVDFGATATQLRDRGLFLYVEPDDRDHVYAIVEHMEQWSPTLVIVDSIGELLPLFGGNSNSADDFTLIHRAVIKPLVKTGACVVGIDHLAKGAESRSFGATGTGAKRRAISGTSIRMKVDVPFTPGKGGSAYLSIHKDRHGGLRAASPIGDREPLAGKFSMWADETSDAIHAKITAPAGDERNPEETAPDDDITAIARLSPPPVSANDAQKRLQWKRSKALAAFKEWKKRGSITVLDDPDEGGSLVPGTTGEPPEPPPDEGGSPVPDPYTGNQGTTQEPQVTAFSPPGGSEVVPDRCAACRDALPTTDEPTFDGMPETAATGLCSTCDRCLGYLTSRLAKVEAGDRSDLLHATNGTDGTRTKFAAVLDFALRSGAITATTVGKTTKYTLPEQPASVRTPGRRTGQWLASGQPVERNQTA